MNLSGKQKSIMREINLGGMTLDQYEPKDRKVVAELMDMGLVKVGAYNLLSLTKKGDTAHDGMVAAADARGWHESQMNYAEINESLEDIIDTLDDGKSLNEEALVEQILTEAHDELVDLMESVGYTLETETAEEALEAVAEFMESDEFVSLSEKEQQKVKSGWKMVFGKLRRLGKDLKTAAAGVGSGELSQAARDAYRSAKSKVSKALGKTKVGKAADAATAKLGLGTKVGSALAKKSAQSQMDRRAGDEARKKGMADFWKKKYAGK